MTVDRRTRGLLAASAVGACAASAFAASGVLNPTYVRPGAEVTPLVRFWAASSAVRTWALSVPVLLQLARGRQPAPELLVTAGLVQLGDAGLGVWQRNPPMSTLPAAMGVLHLLAGRVLARELAGPRGRR